MLDVQHLAKSFGRTPAVRDVTFTARDGRITGLLGPNGAGKSTTLRMLYTVLRPDRGTAHVDGIDVVTNPLAARRLFGALTHNAGVYPHLTARENIVYFGELQGLDRATRERRADELIDLLDMRDFATRRARGYSQGERLKTALARAIVHSPRNILLDEPTNGLDVMAVRTLRQLLRNLRESGHCIVFSSHVMQEVAALCDDVVVVARGEVIASGSPPEILAQSGAASLEDAFVHLIGSDEGLS